MVGPILLITVKGKEKMKERERFIKEFDRIIEELSKEYDPSERSIELVNEIILDLRDIDSEVKILGTNYWIQKYTQDRQVMGDQWNNSFEPHHNGRKDQKEDLRFFLAFWVQAYDFIIKYLKELENKARNKSVKKSVAKDPSYKVIAIVCFCKVGIIITRQNAEDILKKYCKEPKSTKELDEIKLRLNDLIDPIGNKGARKKHMNCLNEARGILNREKDKEAVIKIDKIINTFSTNCKKEYPHDTD